MSSSCSNHNIIITPTYSPFSYVAMSFYFTNPVRSTVNLHVPSPDAHDLYSRIKAVRRSRSCPALGIKSHVNSFYTYGKHVFTRANDIQLDVWVIDEDPGCLLDSGYSVRLWDSEKKRKYSGRLLWKKIDRPDWTVFALEKDDDGKVWRTLYVPSRWVVKSWLDVWKKKLGWGKKEEEDQIPDYIWPYLPRRYGSVPVEEDEDLCGFVDPNYIPPHPTPVPQDPLPSFSSATILPSTFPSIPSSSSATTFPSLPSSPSVVTFSGFTWDQ